MLALAACDGRGSGDRAGPDGGARSGAAAEVRAAAAIEALVTREPY
jgi:hypothetical protein